MKTKNIFLLIVVIVLIIFLFYSFNSGDTDEGYVAQIEAGRKSNERFFETAKESPFAQSKEPFKGLNYFPVDAKYRISADLIPSQEKKIHVLGTNDGKEQRLIEYAHAEFKIDGVECRLVILESIEMGPTRGQLFLAFGDETSARETYGAGRYLDVKKVPGSTSIILDFNKAYNPYCAYNDTYSCPLPPQENLLNVAIRAGEKNYH